MSAHGKTYINTMRSSLLIMLVVSLGVFRSVAAQDAAVNATSAAAAAPVAASPDASATGIPAAVALPPGGVQTPEQLLSSAQNVTLDFKEADIRNILKIISFKSGVNIVATPDVMGAVSIRLIDVPWQRALDVLLKTYGYAYERQGNVILVTKAENISKIQSDEPLQTEIINLKFLDAQDAQKILIPVLSPRGKISVLYTRGQKGWQFGSFKIGRQETGSGSAREAGEAPKTETISIEKSPTGELISRKAEFESSIKSKTLLITDTASSLDRIKNYILPSVDKKPKQVLIETKLIEVNRDKLRDMGVDWGFGSTAAPTDATTPLTTQTMIKNNIATVATVGGRSLSSEATPSVFGPKEGSLIRGIEPYNLGAEIIFKKLTGTKFEAVVHALEEDANANTLSAPKILTLDNQEASILVGFHTPILSSIVSPSSTAGAPATVTQTLDYYQEIGIRLNVVPQVNDEGYINMIIHPSITSSTSSVPAVSTSGADSTTTSYPIIDVREAQTQILLKDGETVVIGGLLKDVISKQTSGIPFLGKIPLIGGMFRRDTYDTQKVDLLMFITAKIVPDEGLSAEEVLSMQENLGKAGGDSYVQEKKKVSKHKK
jgi:type IV pilus assembly protein PilQ